jgi:DNA-binding PadR family transcriptional regulator
MAVKTVILGILRTGPLHGYDLKRIIERDMGDWADIAFGSIYFALDALAKDGFVTAEVQESEHRRPSRIVYTITAAGEAEYFRLLRELWQDRSRQHNPIDVGIAFIRDLPANEVAGYLDGRIAGTEQALEYLRKHEEETLANPNVPAESRFIFSHARHQLAAELDWLREVRDGL